MKKITFCLISSCMLLTFQPLLSKAATTSAPSSVVVSKTAEATEAKTLLLRLNEINTMDKSKLNSLDKKNLRKEVRTIRHELRESNGGVYLSVGAIIIIILLLILLL